MPLFADIANTSTYDEAAVWLPPRPETDGFHSQSIMSRRSSPRGKTRQKRGILEVDMRPHDGPIPLQITHHVSRPEDFHTPEAGRFPQGYKGSRQRIRLSTAPGETPPHGSERPVALGDVWLTTSQERDIMHAGEARRAQADAAAMCPAVSDSSASVANNNEGRLAQLASHTEQSDESPDSHCVAGDQSERGTHSSPEQGSQGSSGEPADEQLINYSAAPADIQPFLMAGGRRGLEDSQLRRPYISPMSAHKFTATTRQLMIDWAMLRQQRLKLSDSTMHLAVQLADEMLTMKGPGPFLQNDTNTTLREALICSQGWDAFPYARLPAAVLPSNGFHHLLENPPFPLKLCRLMISCLFVSAKLLEPQEKCPQASEFAREAASDHLGFGAAQLTRAEAALLCAFRYSLVRPTSACFAGAFFAALHREMASELSASDESDTHLRQAGEAALNRSYEVARYLLDIALQSYTALAVPCSELAAAAVRIACGHGLWLGGTDGCAGGWMVSPGQLDRLTGYSEEQVQQSCTFLLSLCEDAQRHPTLYVNRKHAAVRAFTSSLLDL